MTTQNIYSMTDVWDDVGTTFKGISLSVTDTASASGSLLMDLQVGGASLFSVSKTGQLKLSLGQIAVSATVQINSGNTNDLRSIQAAAGFFQQINMGAGVSTDLSLFRDAADTLAQRRTTTTQSWPQAYRIYGSYTDVSNYERGKIAWESNVLKIGTEKAGTGSARALELQTDGTSRWSVSTAGHLLASADNAYDIGAGGAFRPRDGHFGRNLWTGGWLLALSTSGGSNAARFSSPSDGVVTWTNFATTDFGRIQFGGTTSSFPALKRSTTSLQARLADDSDFTAIQGKITTETAYTAGAPTATGYIVLYDSTGTAYKVPAEAL